MMFQAHRNQGIKFRIVFTFLAFLFMLSVYGQSNNSYHKLINSAELQIIDGHFEKSLELYKAAFRSTDKQFAVDLFNASLCAVNSKDYDYAFELCLRLCKKGVGDIFFEKNTPYQVLRNKPGWNKLLTSASKCKDSLQTESQALLGLFHDLVARDQAVNKLWRDSGFDNKGKERMQMDLVYDSIAAKLLHVFDTEGFVSEFRIGIATVNDTVISTGLPFDVIIIHNYQSRISGDSLFTPVLKLALKSGLIKPYQFAHLQDLGSNSFGRIDYKTAGFYVQYKCSIYKDRAFLQGIESVDKIRESIQLESMEDFLKKIFYRISNPGSRFQFNASVSKYMSFKDKASEDNFLRSFDLVKDGVCK